MFGNRSSVRKGGHPFVRIISLLALACPAPPPAASTAAAWVTSPASPQVNDRVCPLLVRPPRGTIPSLPPRLDKSCWGRVGVGRTLPFRCSATASIGPNPLEAATGPSGSQLVFYYLLLIVSNHC